MPKTSRYVSNGSGVNVVGMFRAELGVGESGRSMVRALRRAGEPTALLDFSAVSANRQNDRSITDFAPSPVYPTTLLCANPPEYPAFGASSMVRAFREGRYRIGSWWWELPELPDDWCGAFAVLDEIWVGSRFIYEAVARVSPIPVTYIPPVVEVPPAAQIDLAKFGATAGEMIVLVMFDFHSVWQRKNPDGAIAAFRRAFRGNERVRLIVKTINGEARPEAKARLYDSIGGDNRISLVDRYLNREDVFRLISSCDAYLSLHRSEGFGLTVAEAMAYGRPVVVTDWSGNVDFATTANSFPVNVELTQLTETYGPYLRGSHWAEPDLSHAAAQLRRIYEDPVTARARGSRGSFDVARRFSTVRVARLVADRLAAIRSSRSGDDE